MGILNIFEKFRDTVIVKEDCVLERMVEHLEQLQILNPKDKIIKYQLYIAKKGLAGENEILYQLKKSNIGMFVLHDVNMVYEDLKAQIDFVVITPWCCYFIECKNWNGNISVNEKGDFILERSLKGHKVKKGIESPYRQVQAQRDVYKKIWLMKQGKLKSFIYEKNFENFHRILVVDANKDTILNTKYAPKEIKNNVIRADAIIRKLEYDRDHSDKDTWDNKKRMREWADYFMKLNVNLERNITTELDEEDADFEFEKESILRDKLLEFRKNKSKEKKIPAYYIFTNDELEKIIEARPKDMEELRNLKVLTDVKINCHGLEIIKILQENE